MLLVVADRDFSNQCGGVFHVKWCIVASVGVRTWFAKFLYFLFSKSNIRAYLIPTLVNVRAMCGN